MGDQNNQLVPKPSQALQPGLSRDRQDADEYGVALRLQFNPVTPVEQILVDELARRAVQMREFEHARGLLRDRAEAALAGVLGASGDSPIASLSVGVAVASGQHEAVMRQGLSAARGFYRGLDALQKLQADRHTDDWIDLLRPDPRFNSEQACCAYLVRRYADGRQRCGRCGQSAGGSFIAARQCWECGRCHAQTGLRVGTVMERSALTLTKWFGAIRAVLLRPTIAPAQLAKALDIDRVQTVRDMIRKIRQAAAAENANSLLVGLAEVYLAIT